MHCALRKLSKLKLKETCIYNTLHVVLKVTNKRQFVHCLITPFQSFRPVRMIAVHLPLLIVTLELILGKNVVRDDVIPLT